MRKSYSTPSRSRTRIHGLPRRSSRSTAARTASSARRCATSPSATPCPTPSLRAC
nr:MAG TPA: hypothetical protein [Caudoviricetes sp.]